MNILLDTNALLTLLGSRSSSTFSSSTIECLEAAENVYYSPISLVEIHIKAMLGKLRVPEELKTALEKTGLAELPYTASDAESLRHFEKLKRHDPFDRMLLAQAFTNHLSFLTSDRYLVNLGLNYVLNSNA